MSETAVFRVGKYPLAGGLVWTAVQNNSEFKKFVGKGSKFAKGPKDGHGEHVGRVEGQIAEKGTIYAAGLLVGLRFPNAIIYHEIADSESTWICIVEDGVPMPEWDKVIPYGSHTAEARAEFSSASSISSSESQKIGSFQGATYTLDDALQQLDESLSQKQITSKQIQSTKLQTNGFNWIAFAVFTLVALIVAGCALAAVIYREKLADERQRKSMIEKMTKSQQELDAIAAKQAKALADFQSRVRTETSNFGRQEVAVPQWRECEVVRRGIPLSWYGYVPTKITCDFVLGKAEVEWQVTGQGTHLSDRAAIPGVVDKYSVGLVALSRYDLKGLDGLGSPVVPHDPAAVRMAILDWAHIRLPGITIAEPVPVELVPGPDIAGMPGIAKVSLGSKAPVLIMANGASDMTVLPSAMGMLNSYAINFEKIVWSQPATGALSMNATGTLYLPAGKL